MQTERVTFLTSPAHKAALDAFAAGNGISVAHVLREASTRYLGAGDAGEAEDEAALAVLVREVEAAVPAMRADIRDTIASIQRANDAVDAILAGERA